MPRGPSRKTTCCFGSCLTAARYYCKGPICNQFGRLCSNHHDQICRICSTSVPVESPPTIGTQGELSDENTNSATVNVGTNVDFTLIEPVVSDVLDNTIEINNTNQTDDLRDSIEIAELVKGTINQVSSVTSLTVDGMYEMLDPVEWIPSNVNCNLRNVVVRSATCYFASDDLNDSTRLIRFQDSSNGSSNFKISEAQLIKLQLCGFIWVAGLRSISSDISISATNSQFPLNDIIENSPNKENTGFSSSPQVSSVEFSADAVLLTTANNIPAVESFKLTTNEEPVEDIIQRTIGKKEKDSYSLLMQLKPNSGSIAVLHVAQHCIPLYPLTLPFINCTFANTRSYQRKYFVNINEQDKPISNLFRYVVLGAVAVGNSAVYFAKSKLKNTHRLLWSLQLTMNTTPRVDVVYFDSVREEFVEEAGLSNLLKFECDPESTISDYDKIENWYYEYLRNGRKLYNRAHGLLKDYLNPSDGKKGSSDLAALKDMENRWTPIISTSAIKEASVLLKGDLPCGKYGQDVIEIIDPPSLPKRSVTATNMLTYDTLGGPGMTPNKTKRPKVQPPILLPRSINKPTADNNALIQRLSKMEARIEQMVDAQNGLNTNSNTYTSTAPMNNNHDGSNFDKLLKHTKETQDGLFGMFNSSQQLWSSTAIAVAERVSGKIIHLNIYEYI